MMGLIGAACDIKSDTNPDSGTMDGSYLIEQTNTRADNNLEARTGGSNVDARCVREMSVSVAVGALYFLGTLTSSAVTADKLLS